MAVPVHVPPVTARTLKETRERKAETLSIAAGLPIQGLRVLMTYKKGHPLQDQVQA